jgi:hypothetical protein
LESRVFGDFFVVRDDFGHGVDYSGSVSSDSRRRRAVVDVRAEGMQ